MYSLKYILFDVLRSICIGILIALGLGVFITLIALIFRLDILQVLFSAWIFTGCIGMFIGGMSFLWPNTQRPLDHRDDWEKYFKKLNIGFVILFIGITILILGLPVYNIWWSLKYGV
jgi:magnesium-transporting ATPase (P-type)